MKFYIENNIYTIQCRVEEFAIELVNERKKNIDRTNYVNANFFGSYNEPGEAFTLPAGHLVADYKSNSIWVKHYCDERGKFIGGKFYFDSNNWRYGNQFYQKNLSCLIIENGKAKIAQTQTLSDSYQYCVSGVPVMKNGKDVKFAVDVKGEGYDASTLYATKHIFVAMKQNDEHIYILGAKTTTSNMILSAEMFKRLSKLGYYNVIKLDGGGSYHYEVNGEVKDSTFENRRINAIIVVNNLDNIDPASSWADQQWTNACLNGIFDGKNPKNAVTREQLAVILDKLGKI